MKKPANKSAQPQMRADYDFSRGARGKYARRFAQGTNVVVVESDVAKVFPSSETVNSSLRSGWNHSSAGKGAGYGASRTHSVRVRYFSPLAASTSA